MAATAAAAAAAAGEDEGNDELGLLDFSPGFNAALERLGRRSEKKQKWGKSRMLAEQTPRMTPGSAVAANTSMHDASVDSVATALDFSVDGRGGAEGGGGGGGHDSFFSPAMQRSAASLLHDVTSASKTPGSSKGSALKRKLATLVGKISTPTDGMDLTDDLDGYVGTLDKSPRRTSPIHMQMSPMPSPLPFTSRALANAKSAGKTLVQ